MLNDLIIKPLSKWSIHDLIYARVTDYKCFDSLALGRDFFKSFIELSRVQYYLDTIWSIQTWRKR